MLFLMLVVLDLGLRLRLELKSLDCVYLLVGGLPAC